MNIKRIILAGVLVWSVSTVIRWLTCGWLFSWVYQIPPVEIWKTPEMIMAFGNTVGSLAVGLLAAVIFALVFGLLYRGIPKKC